MQQRAQWAATLLVVLLPVALWWLAPQVMAKGLIPSPWDKLAHLLSFALLALAIGLASGQREARAALLAFVGTVLVGALDEWMQRGQPGRTADWLDLAADATGAALGCLVLVVLAQLRDGLMEHAGQKAAQEGLG